MQSRRGIGQRMVQENDHGCEFRATHAVKDRVVQTFNLMAYAFGFGARFSSSPFLGPLSPLLELG
jgi:hypothetical protein